jgi:cellobiose phosphorylase
MFYIYIAAVILLSILVAYLVLTNDEYEENNLLEDVPNIYVNKEGLEKHAMQISNYYSDIKNANCRRKLIKSLQGSYNSILKGYEYIDKNVKYKKEVIPAAEWLLDNVYLVEKEYKDIKHNMPESYYKNLPMLDKGIMKGYPRIYHIAVEIVSHTDGLIDEGIIESFIQAYQKNTLLTSGELWALPIMLRIALIQNISKIVDKIRFAQIEKNKGDSIADSLINAINDKRLTEEINKLNHQNIKFTSHLVERLIKVLRNNCIDNLEMYQWIDEKLEVIQSDIERMINIEHQKEAYYQISIGNSIISIRAVEALNWRDFFEKVSYVEKILKKDPVGVYDKMDFESRDHYRHELEKLSRKMNLPESYVAKNLIECAEQYEAEEKEIYKKHIGYYIIDDGVKILVDKLCLDKKIGYKLRCNIKKNSVTEYITSIVVGTSILEGIVLMMMSKGNNVELWKYIIAAIVILIPSSEIVISVLNWSINNITKPSFIPKLSLEDGIPEESSTIVVIPSLVNDEKRVKELIHNMEVYFLANNNDNLYFALLSDFKDSKVEKEAGDQRIIKVALKEISELNEKYSFKGKDKIGERDKFYFFSRKRKFNEKQELWMGWERKRGKLMEFNQLIRGGDDTTYDVISGDISSLKKCKYIITLDGDTMLPRDAGKKLIGAMSHILNRPYFDNNVKGVIRGYGLMQPRVSVGCINANKTMFSKIFSGETGIDMYTTAISDVYQDTFNEGIFTGKGIYDVDVFQTVLQNEIPENTVLSHDLLEGCYAKTALVTDIELVDGYPATYNSSSMRLHRWARGDWQLLPWLKKSSPLNTLSRWKITDNLRRSLLAPAIIILLIVTLLLLPIKEVLVCFAFLAVLCPIFFDVSEAVVGPIKGISLSGKLLSIKPKVEQFFLIFSFLPYQGYLMLDAVIRTLHRLFISKRNLLEWQTAADVEAKSGRTLKDYLRYMWAGSGIAIAIAIISFGTSRGLGLLMLPSVVIWFVSPLTAYYISKDIVNEGYAISKKDYELIRKLSRKTWAYFEDFVNSENNWLAPDNYQEDPQNGVAHRTSPTNIGMGFVSAIAAHDLGYIGVTEAVDKIDRILTSVESLSKYKGHLYNWYDTLTKAPLFPKYVSTVDSGNLVCYMWVTSEALYQYINGPLINEKSIAGMKDLIELAYEESKAASRDENSYKAIFNNLQEFNIFSWKDFLVNVRSVAIDVEKLVQNSELYWNNKIKSSTSKLLGELQHLAPWVDLAKNNVDNELKEKLIRLCNEVPLKEMKIEIDNIIANIDNLSKVNNTKTTKIKHLNELKELLLNSSKEVEKELNRVYELQTRLNNFVDDTDFKPLFDKKRELFSIGYDAENDSINNSYYDLLASEARGASFIAIAKGDVEQKHWFKLGRSMTIMGSSKGLVSWSGTMFEYFMPLLIMKDYPESLLHETYKAVIEGQKQYCKERKVPWGISESAYNTFDVNLNYQYKAFGVPGIGLKRGLANELVVAPYATVMTLQIDFLGAIENIRRLIKEGAEGRYGLYEAIDYSKDRLPKGKKKALVKCFMVHHEGMSLMALNNVLNNNIFQERFHNIPKVKATELLLQEKVPRRIVYDREQQFNLMDSRDEKYSVIVRAYNTAKTEMPEAHLLSNGKYSLMITNSGSGYSKKEDMGIYRWREDSTLDSSGMFFYIKNINSNEYWSTAYEPCKSEGEDYSVIFSLDKAEFKRKDGNLTTHMEIAVSSEDEAEVRRITITNHSEHSRIVEITSYCEVTLTTYNADIVHPTFSNLFIMSEYIDSENCIIANRRPRSEGAHTPWMVQTVAVDGESIGTIQYETSRLNFTGRGRNLSSPEVIENDTPLLNTVGAVLDPIISIRRRVRIKAGESCKIAYTTGICDSREGAIGLAAKYKELQNVNRVFDMAWTQSQVEMEYLGIKSNGANLYQIMASRILFLNEHLRDREEYIKKINKYQKDLWSYGISGDVPIVLLRVKEDKDLDLVRQMLSAHEYWSIKGLKVDLVVINEEVSSYSQPFQDSLRDLISSSHAREMHNKQGRVYLNSKATMDEGIISLLMAISRLVIDSEKGTLMKQIRDDDELKKEVSFIKVEAPESQSKEKEAVSYIRSKIAENSNNSADEYDENKGEISKLKVGLNKLLENETRLNIKWDKKPAFSTEFGSEIIEYKRTKERLKYDVSKLLYFNGYGGFNKANGNYVIVLSDFQNTPAPWINVMSNESFGFHVSESGSAYTWSRNSRENKLTPWNNDPISDIPGEILYIRDEDTGDVWNITPKPLRDGGEYVIEHGFGYSSFSHEAYGIEGTETMFTSIDEDCKICIVKLKNKTKEKRVLSASYYAHMVLGVVPQATAQYIYTYIDREKSYIYAVNPYSEHFGKLKTFLKINGGKEESFTGSRKEFLGRGENIEQPIAMKKSKLSGLCGAGMDPCVAINSKIELSPGEEKTISIVLGQYEDLGTINSCLEKYSDINKAEESLENTKMYWKNMLGNIQVSTPDKTMDLMLNGWLIYQTLSCRYWARTAFYQSGGAYGYRDQLQDTLSIGLLDSSFTKEQIVRSAERQFIQGDVQHWWHPVVDSGIRTRFSDDLLWLPYVTADYINKTGDYSILDLEVNYLEDEPLKEGEDERYNIARRSEKKGSIYEHCIKAIEKGLKFGRHNIPLMGSGDWNDGMSTVGNKGQGESIWLGWFLYDILDDFKDLCAYKDDDDNQKKYVEVLSFLKENMEKNAWDGSWYRRAYFDDGKPLGSIENDECQIDSIAQSWAVISGAAKESRARLAMESLEKYLIREDTGMILLLTPPFNKSDLEPGYIKGYVPGVRENGGQYTHAAVWAIMAMAKLGKGDEALKLYNMINPINHATTTLECERYKVEPYVMAADVYIKEPHTGRGGWSWYTGAAGWMFKVGIESILGLNIKGGQGFTIEPNIPISWDSYEIKYTKDECIYHIKVKRGKDEDKRIILDGEVLNSSIVPYMKDGHHLVEVII